MSVQLNNSILKAFAILGLFSDRRLTITAATVAEELGLNVVTAHRLLRTLERAGALVRVSKGSYRLGFVFVDLAERVTAKRTLAQTLQPLLQELAGDLRESCMATTFEADSLVCIACAHPDRELVVDIRIGTRMEAYCTANGKLWLASLPEAELTRYLESVALKPFSRATLTNARRLRAELEIVRRRGYALNEGEREDGIRAVAVPLVARNGTMVAGLSVFGPHARMSDAFVETALEGLRRTLRQADLAFYGGPANEGEAVA